MSDTKETKKNKGQEYAETIANELIKHLKEGTAPWQIPWTPANGHDLPYNHTTGKAYLGSNTLALMMQMRSDPRWMTYKQAQSIDAQVKKGERGTTLIHLITHTEHTKRDENGNPVLDEKGDPVKVYVKLEQPFIKSFTVFNGEQIEGLPILEKVPAKYQWEPIEKAEQILTASHANIEHKPSNRAAYYPKLDTIFLPEKKQFPEQAAYYSTALHELGHWTGHSSRLKRDLSGKFGSESYAKEELRAEIASMMLSRELGLPHDTSQHAAYVKSWIQVLQDEPMEILHASKDAQQIMEYVRSFDRTQDIAQQLDNAKQAYQQQREALPPEKQHKQQVLEQLLSTVTINLSEADQKQAKLNFYHNQLQEMKQSPSLTAKEEIEVER